MPSDGEGAPWPDPAQGTRFTWGPPSEDATPPEVRYATWGRRGMGFLVDFLVMAAVPFAFFIAFSFSLPETSNPDPPMTAASWVWFWCWLASCSVFVLYPVWFIGRRGQTPGMRRMRIRLFQMDREGNLETPSRPARLGPCGHGLRVLAPLRGLDPRLSLAAGRHASAVPPRQGRPHGRRRRPRGAWRARWGRLGVVDRSPTEMTG